MKESVMENRINLNTALFTINFKSNFIELNCGIKINITHIESNVLYLLFSNPSTIYSRDEILDYAWNDNSNNYDSAVPQTISLLRKKLHKHHIDAIETIKGQGYKANKNILDTEIDKKKNTLNINRVIRFSLVFLFLAISSYFFLTNYVNDKILPLTQKLEAKRSNLKVLSTSLPIDVDYSLLKDDINYFINRSEKVISLSACKISGNSCSAIYNEFIFYTDKVDINNYISKIDFEEDKPNVFHNSDGKFSAVSKINLSSSDNPNYHGVTYINFDIKTKNKDFFMTEFSNSTVESGYDGHYNINTSFNMSLVSKVKSEINHKFIYATTLKSEHDSLAESRTHFGMIQNQNDTLLYNFIFDTGRVSTYKHYYPVYNDIGYLYQENFESAVLIFTYN